MPINLPEVFIQINYLHSIDNYCLLPFLHPIIPLVSSLLSYKSNKSMSFIFLELAVDPCLPSILKIVSPVTSHLRRLHISKDCIALLLSMFYKWGKHNGWI